MGPNAYTRPHPTKRMHLRAKDEGVIVPCLCGPFGVLFPLRIRCRVNCKLSGQSTMTPCMDALGVTGKYRGST